MEAEPLVSRVLDDEGLTDGLNDPEARVLVEWLVGQAEDAAAEATDESSAWKRLEAVCRRARAIRRFISLWYHAGDKGAATQLAGAERFLWPLPTSDIEDPCEFLERALEQEAEYLSHRHARGAI